MRSRYAAHVHIFISHAHHDSKFAEQMGKLLEAAGYEVWTDRQILPGDNWASAIGRALETADALVALISPAALESEFVRREWEYALGQERFRDRLIPIEIRRTAAKPWILEKLSVLQESNPRVAAKRIVDRLQSTGRRTRGSS